ncbi:MAG: DNA internalization-related competence protein ComEC/Rec2 [Desulfovibrionaceae bacterium]|nr:DNA internalization-related competence protein ComEC/Rec2 [Desulfovibrionaceae bacterium]
MNAVLNGAAKRFDPSFGLLGWQVLFLAFVLGLLSLEYPFAACCGLALVWAMSPAARRGLRGALILALFFLIGAGWVRARAPEPAAPIPAWVLARDKVLLEGRVVEVESRPGQRITVLLAGVRRVDGPADELPGLVKWTWQYPGHSPVEGRTVRLKARVRPIRGFGTPGAWDLAGHWRRRGVFFSVYTRGAEGGPLPGSGPEGPDPGLRRALRRAALRGVAQTQGGAMVLALVTGDRFLLEDRTLDLARAAGLAHSLALSGLHLGFVACLGLGLAHLVGLIRPETYLRLPRPKMAVLLAAPLVLGYAWLGQPSPSLIRAACMFGSWGALLLMDRDRVLLDGLFMALVLILAVSPLAVFDLRLQLSALAVAGIALLRPLFGPFFAPGPGRVRRVAHGAARILVISLCATLALLPLTVSYFGTLSPNILLNVVWLPVLGFAVLPLGLLGLIVQVLAPGLALGAWLLQAASAIAEAMLWLLELLDARGLLPVVALLRPLWPEILGCGLLLICLAAYGRTLRGRGLVCLGLLLMVLPQAWVMVGDCADRVGLDVLDVGQGQALVVRTPGGRRCLVDGGGLGGAFDVGGAVVGPYLARGRPPVLDAVVMTHPDQDHAQGLVWILGRFKVGRFFYNNSLPKGRLGEDLRAAMRAAGLRAEALWAGDSLDLGRNTVLRVLHPAPGFESPESNENSLVLVLDWQGRGLALLPADVGQKGIRAFLKRPGPLSADVLVLPHHGSATGLSRELYRRCGPRAALCSCGFLNSFGFPSARAAEALAGLGCPLLSTADLGLLSVSWEAPDAGPVVSAASGGREFDFMADRN